MKKLLITLVLILLAHTSWAGGLMMMGGGVAVAPTGDPVWYYSAGSDSYTDDQYESITATNPLGSNITIASGGSITQLGFKVYVGAGTHNFKIGLYDTSGNRLTAATCTGTTSNEWNVWKDCELSSPYTVSASTIRVWVSTDSNVGILQDGASGGYWATKAYADFPDTTISGTANELYYAVRAYVE